MDRNAGAAIGQLPGLDANTGLSGLNVTPFTGQRDRIVICSYTRVKVGKIIHLKNLP